MRDVRMFVGGTGNLARLEIEIEDEREEQRVSALASLAVAVAALRRKQVDDHPLVLFVE